MTPNFSYPHSINSTPASTPGVHRGCGRLPDDMPGHLD